MAGALTNCAFLGLARIAAICFAAGADAFVRPALIGFGLFSLAIAAAFIIGQTDIKRLLAYSSVEHMGILVLALGIGGAGAYGAVLHALNNGLAKGMVFLAVGNVVLATGTSTAAEIRGLVRRLPFSGILLVVGLFALTGSPPFGMFISEFTILRAAIGQHHPWIAALFLALLAIIFVGLGSMILEMVYGTPSEALPARQFRESVRLVAAPAAMAVLVLLLGLHLPGPLAHALSVAATMLGGRSP
jgi:hydrogenase-4 component F